MKSALRAAWLGLLLPFTDSQASLSSALTAESDSLYIWNDTLDLDSPIFAVYIN